MPYLVMLCTCVPDRVRRACEARGLGTVAVNVARHRLDDLSDPQLLKVLMGWVRASAVLGVWASLPWATWAPGPLRIRKFDSVLHVSRASEAAGRAVRVANALAESTVKLIAECIFRRVPIIFMHPESSLVWRHPRLSPLLASASSSCSLDSCMYAGRVRQRIHLVGWGVRDLGRLARRCLCAQGLCDRSHRRHLGGLGRPALDAVARSSAKGLPLEVAMAGTDMIVAEARQLSRAARYKKLFGQ